MGEEVADYPSHRELLAYFRDFADEFGLRDGLRVRDRGRPRRARSTGAWEVTVRSRTVPSAPSGTRACVLANGTLSEPSVPTFAGSFDGEVLHTSRYKSASVFAGKRVLVIGAGNSGCDIAVDAVHHARVGRHLACAAATTSCRSTSSASPPTPSTRAGRCRRGSSRPSTAGCSRLFTGDPVRFGFPKPDYKIYESHPIVNTLILHHLGHGDVRVRRDVRAAGRRRGGLQRTASAASTT